MKQNNRVRFVGMLSDALVASLLGNVLAGKGFIRAGEQLEQGKEQRVQKDEE